MSTRRAATAMGVVCLASAAAGCEIVIDLRDYTVVDELDGGTGATGGGGAAGTGGVGGVGGVGGTGGTGGAQVCSPGETQPCYSGADGTKGVGVCLGGTQTCDGNGSGFGACEGEVTPTEEDCTKLGNEACTGALGCSDPVFFRQYGDNDIQWGDAVAVEPATGNTYLAAHFSGATKIGDEAFINNGGDDVFVAKVDPAGEPIWAKAFGSDQFHYARSVKSSPEGGVVFLVNPGKGVDFGGGLTTLNSAVVKLDGNGNFVWSRGCTQSGNPSSTPIKNIAVDGEGNVVVIGDVSGGVDCGAGQVPMSPAFGDRVFIAKFSAAGNLQWMKVFGLSGTKVSGDAIAVDTAGNILAGGSFTEKINFGSVIDLVDSGGGGDAFVVKLDSAGGHEWSLSFGDLGSERQKTEGLAVDSLGAAVLGVVFAGEMTVKGTPYLASGPRDLLILKIGAGGAIDWAKHVGSLENPDLANVEVGSLRVAVDQEDNILLGGDYEGTLNFGGEDLAGVELSVAHSYLAKLDGSGNHRWSKKHSVNGNYILADIAVGQDGRVVVVGGFGGIFDVGLGPQEAKAVDVFLAQLAP